MPYRALTHGRINAPNDFKGSSGTGKNVGTGLAGGIAERSDSQKKAYNSQAGVANSGSNISLKNKLHIQSGRVGGSRPTYARMLKRDLLIPKNAFGPDSGFAPNQGKGFPSASPMTSVGSTNKFARRAILRRAETKTRIQQDYVAGTTDATVGNCKCDN